RIKGKIGSEEMPAQLIDPVLVGPDGTAIPLPPPNRKGVIKFGRDGWKPEGGLEAGVYRLYSATGQSLVRDIELLFYPGKAQKEGG
ncbi:MAG: hypothetical protein ABII12_12005, partial [Planctomycetota bacterium]